MPSRKDNEHDGNNDGGCDENDDKERKQDEPPQGHAAASPSTFPFLPTMVSAA